MSSFNTAAQIVAYVAEKQPSGALLAESRPPEPSSSSHVDPVATQVASGARDDGVDKQRDHQLQPEPG